MTYRLFLAVLLLPQLVLAAVLFALRYRASAAPRRADLRRGAALVAGLAAVALVYTAPWDGWLIRHHVWGYPPGSVLGTVAVVPIEEYLFMIGQTLMTGCWMLAVGRAPGASLAGHGWRRPVHTLGWLLAAGAGALLTTRGHSLYLGAIVVWFAPLLALQAAFGADVLRVARTWRVTGLAVTVALWVSDGVAIHEHAWHVSAAYTVGLRPFGLPLEEAVFFLLTNVLIVNSVVLVSAPAMRGRLVARFGVARAGRAAARRQPLPPAARVPDHLV
jgi:lycopene beta-cyclase